MNDSRPGPKSRSDSHTPGPQSKQECLSRWVGQVFSFSRALPVDLGRSWAVSKNTRPRTCEKIRSILGLQGWGTHEEEASSRAPNASRFELSQDKIGSTCSSDEGVPDSEVHPSDFKSEPEREAQMKAASSKQTATAASEPAGGGTADAGATPAPAAVSTPAVAQDGAGDEESRLTISAAVKVSTMARMRSSTRRGAAAPCAQARGRGVYTRAYTCGRIPRRGSHLSAAVRAPTFPFAFDLYLCC